MTDVFMRLQSAIGDRYRLQREVGAGGMAMVFLANDRKHDRDVALKVLRPDLCAVVGAERFLAEIRYTARLDHPHILTLIDSGETGGLLWYVLPYVRGQSLRSRLDSDRQLPLADAVAIARQVASALQYAHDHGIVHRDVKPENILLHEGEAVVTDFGIALAVREAGGTRLTESGLSLGTPQYMSPEQATGERDLDARSDQYSLAAVLYEMLGGEPPHTGGTVQSIIAKLLSERPTPLRILRNAVPQHVAAAVDRGLAKVPADRFPTMRAFADALAQPARVDGPTAARLSGWLRRHSRLVGAAAVALVLGGLAVAGSRRAPRLTAAGPNPRRLAVLYFRSLAGDTLLPVADGLTEGLIRELSRTRPLNVVSPNGVLPYRGAAAPLDSIARALDVGTLVEGSVGTGPGTLRVGVSLVNAVDGSVLRSASFELPRGDVLVLQDSLIAAVSQFLREHLEEKWTLSKQRATTRNAEAWQLVQEAHLAAREVTPLLRVGDTGAARRQLVHADTLLERAATLDRGWATPLVERARLGWAATELVDGANTHGQDEITQRGLQYVAEALAMDPANADGLALRGTLRYWRFVLNLGASRQAVLAAVDSAEADFRASVAVDPQQSQAWFMLSHLLMRTNRTAEAKLAAMRAYESDPYSPNASGLLWRLYAASLDLEDRVEATRWCDEGRRRFPDTPNFVECQITVQALPGQHPDVPAMWRLLERHVALYPPQVQEFRRRRDQLLVAMTLMRAGLADSARAVALRVRTDATNDPYRSLVYLELVLRNLLGDRDEALRLAAQYYASQPQDQVDCGPSGGENLDRTWWMRGLVDDPRFRLLACRSR